MLQHQEFLTVLHLSRSIGKKIDFGLRSNGIHLKKNLRPPILGGPQCKIIKIHGYSLETKKIHSWRSGMAGKSFKTFIWAESGLSRASKNLPEMHRPVHDFGLRRMLADSVAEQGLNFDRSATYLIRMTESWCREHLSKVLTIRSKIGVPPARSGRRPAGAHS